MKEEQFSIKNIPNLYGIVACGGKSLRMGTDKSTLVYHDKEQRYHVYDLLEFFCEKVFISCNQNQSYILHCGYHFLSDLPSYCNSGPMAALLTAFESYPGKDIILLGCDYPLLTATELNNFIKNFMKERQAAAFYNDKEDVYEPLLAFYPYSIAETVKHAFGEGNRSLQYVLREANAVKYHPSEPAMMNSIDTMDEHIHIRQLLQLEK